MWGSRVRRPHRAHGSIERTRGSRVYRALSAWIQPHVCSAELSRQSGQALNVSGTRISQGPPALHARGSLQGSWPGPRAAFCAAELSAGLVRGSHSCTTTTHGQWTPPSLSSDVATNLPAGDPAPPLSRVRQHPQSAPARPPSVLLRPPLGTGSAKCHGLGGLGPGGVCGSPQPRGKKEPLPRVPVGQASHPITP